MPNDLPVAPYKGASAEEGREAVPDDFVEELFFGEEPWILPSELPGVSPDIPPGGVEPVVGDSCESLNMDPMATDSLEAQAAGALFQYGSYPWCRLKPGQPAPPAPKPDVTPSPPVVVPPSPPPPGYPYVVMDEPGLDALCTDKGYTKKRNIWIAAIGGAAGGALIGGLFGHAMKKRR